jgi:hypothetical protein
VQGARGDRVELLVGVAQRQVPVRRAVGASSGKSLASTVSVLLASSTQASRRCA